ncbi:MAG: RICIN domain-containing protein [Oscillospiraceae bacterium]
MDNSTHEKGAWSKSWRWTPGNSNQMWKLISTSESDVYELCPTVNTGRAVGHKDASTANNAVVQLHTANGSDAQKFKILRNSDGTFCIRTR